MMPLSNPCFTALENYRMFCLGRDCLCRREAPAAGRFISPLCWRCSGMAAGLAPGVALTLCMDSALLAALASGLAALPAGADVLCQIASDYRSNRWRRVVTGL